MSDSEETRVADEPEPETFPAEYVRELREENASRRIEAKEATERAATLSRVALEHAVERSATSLKTPADLLLYVEPADLVGEDGLPDPEKIADAVRNLLEQRPYLDARKPEGDIDQGRRGEQQKVFDLSRMLRDAAG